MTPHPPHLSSIAPSRIGVGLVLLLLLALLVLVWRAFPVSLAGSTSAARSPEAIAAAAATLTPPPGFSVAPYATGLGEARAMVLTPRGDIILSSPPDRVLLVRADANGDGKADGVETLIGGLDNVSGLLLDDGFLYLAEEGEVSRVPFDIEMGGVGGGRETLVADMPHGKGHWTRTINKGPDGFFYVSVGSSCNACLERNKWRASLIRFMPGETPTVFASGLRNMVGFDWQPGTGDLYGVDNGRDWLGDDYPPDEVNRIVEGGFYGFPYLNGDNEQDPDFGQRGGDRIKTALPPALELEAHLAPISLRFLRHAEGAAPGEIALVAEHGSWNRSTKTGYRLVALKWRDGKISEEPFLTGFLTQGKVSGRPVDIVEAPDGTIFVSDDFAGAIWRVARK
jgi:glucose/arabinose dehydrogenase